MIYTPYELTDQQIQDIEKEITENEIELTNLVAKKILIDE